MSSVAERNFSSYELGDNVYGLAHGLLIDIAEKAEYELGNAPTEARLKGLIEVLGPEKELQKNIELVKSNLGNAANETIANWVDRSGILAPLDRNFVINVQGPEEVDSVVMTGGVARWMLRREAVVRSLDPEKVGMFYLPLGTREMKPTEHQMVTNWVKTNDRNPTEYEFGRDYIMSSLRGAGIPWLKMIAIEVDSENGDEVLGALFVEFPQVLDGTVKVVSNAPNGIQAAGQLRIIAQDHDPGFDKYTDQLSVITDAIPLARKGEKPATHQNPVTALGQLARNALYLHLNSTK